MRAYLLLSVTMLFWSGNWIAGRAVHDLIPPIGLNFWRWVIAALVLAPFVVPRLRGRWPDIRRQWRRYVVLGVTGMMIFQVMLYWGLGYTEAINGTLLNSTTPIFMILVSWAMAGDRVTGRQLVGLALSLLGVTAILSRGDPDTLRALSFNIGDLVILLAMPVWALYSNLLRRYDTGFDGLSNSFLIICFGIILQIPFVIGESLLYKPVPPTWDAVVAFLYIGVFASALGMWFWTLGVAEIGPNRAGFTLHLLPMFGAILAILILGERIRWFHFAGFALILLGVGLSTILRRKHGAAVTPR